MLQWIYMLCKNSCGHKYDKKLEELPRHQGKQGRHLCAGCAYQQGYEDGEKREEPNLKFSKLLGTQGGTGRHKSVECAYCLGYIDGFKANS